MTIVAAVTVVLSVLLVVLLVAAWWTYRARDALVYRDLNDDDISV